MTTETAHRHKFVELRKKKVILRRYVKDHAQMSYQGVSGHDYLVYRRCECGATETFTLIREQAMGDEHVNQEREE